MVSGWSLVGACVLGPFTLITLIAACGGASTTDVTDPGGTAGADGGDGGPSSPSSREGGPASGGGPEAGSSTDGGVDPPGAAPGGNASSLPCGTTTCALPAESCCVSDLGNGSLGYACIATGAACGSGGANATALSCSATANCPAGSVCCASDATKPTSSQCRSACGAKEAQLCDPKAATTGCAASAPCSSQNIADWGLSTAYATCGGVGN